ncbi:hypothetical protein GGH94_004998 [Coemansia aciculifera]|uniref:PRA1 family protein n=1 Tax=Coemansia aciculifera TaxID=417176 RepID=A0A9W8M4A3_9FUNG|nr:hypothetical protein GGH94_004998 [Coemansia aciculifera]KAJ2879729.1 hypothetical protein H4R27_005137 [Coemansia aciculifera]
MSDYSPIEDHDRYATAAPYKSEHNNSSSNVGGGGGSYSSHPYSSSYGGSRGEQPESQAIQVTPPSTSSAAGGGYHAYGGGEPTAGPSTFSSQDGGQRISRYETSLSLRYDIEASLAYVLGIFSGKQLWIPGHWVGRQLCWAWLIATLHRSNSFLGKDESAFLLILEKKNDYVRFHAWQSSLMSATFILALIISALISNSIYYFVILTVVASHVYMVRRAYFDGAVFERFELPYVGPLASQLVDEE